MHPLLTIGATDGQCEVLAAAQSAGLGLAIAQSLLPARADAVIR
jgi:hypothetical protein